MFKIRYKRIIWVCCLLLLLITPLSGVAQKEQSVQIDLNKLQNQQQNCQVVLVFENKSKHFYTSFYLDLVFFNKNGILAQHITVDGAPLRDKKTIVKEFIVPELNCSDISRVLLNSITQCKLKKGAIKDCIGQVKIKSSSQIEFVL